MKKASWEYTCDWVLNKWCPGEVTRDVETMPDGWRLVLVGTDSRGPSKWESKRYVCPHCYPYAALGHGGLGSVDADKD